MRFTIIAVPFITAAGMAAASVRSWGVRSRRSAEGRADVITGHRRCAVRRDTPPRPPGPQRPASVAQVIS